MLWQGFVFLTLWNRDVSERVVSCHFIGCLFIGETHFEFLRCLTSGNHFISGAAVDGRLWYFRVSPITLITATKLTKLKLVIYPWSCGLFSSLMNSRSSDVVSSCETTSSQCITKNPTWQCHLSLLNFLSSAVFCFQSRDAPKQFYQKQTALPPLVSRYNTV